MQAPTLPAGSPPASLHIARFLLQDRAFFLFILGSSLRYARG